MISILATNIYIYTLIGWVFIPLKEPMLNWKKNGKKNGRQSQISNEVKCINY
jgi:hypothetical protein